MKIFKNLWAREAPADTVSPGPEMLPAERAQITRLPKTIARLKAVKHLILNGAALFGFRPKSRVDLAGAVYAIHVIPPALVPL